MRLAPWCLGMVGYKTYARPVQSCPRPGLHPARLHRTRLLVPGPSRGHRLENDGRTDINDLTFACGPDNRLIETTGWTTRKRQDGRTEWIPPPDLDTGQTRVNNYHHPERYLLSDHEDDP